MEKKGVENLVVGGIDRPRITKIENSAVVEGAHKRLFLFVLAV